MTDAAMTLAVLNAIRADLFMVDLSRPQTRGAELIERLRRDEQWTNFPIIATGARMNEYVLLRGRVGIGEVLTEHDSSPTLVLDQVRRYAALSRLSREPELPGARNN